MKKFIKNEITEEQMSNMLQKEVFDNPDYERHIKEVAERLNLPVDVVGNVVEDYIRRIGKMIIKPFKIKRSIVILGFFKLLVQETIYNPRSKNYINFKELFNKK